MPIPRAALWVGGSLLTAAAGLAIWNTVREREEEEETASIPTDSKGLNALTDLMRAAGTPINWQVFFAAVAHHESRWYSSAHNPSPSEKAASVQAYDNTINLFGGCSWPKSRYTIGSGGWFGFLPPYGMKRFAGTSKICADPYKVFDPVWAFAMAVGYARSMKTSDRYKVNPTFLNLNRSWRGVTYMGTEPVEGSDDRFRKALDALRARGWSIPAGWEYKTPGVLPLPSPSKIVDQFAGVAVMQPGVESPTPQLIEFPNPQVPFRHEEM